MKNRFRFFTLMYADQIGFGALLLAITLSVLIVFGLGGCSPVKRITRIAANHPDAAAVVCTRLYPVKENTRVEVRTQIDTLTIPGTTVFVNCDSAVKYRTDSSAVMVQVPCPPAQLITKMVTKDSIVTVESTARLAAVTAERDLSKAEAAAANYARKTWMWIALLAGGYLVLKGAARIAFPSFTILKSLP